MAGGCTGRPDLASAVYIHGYLVVVGSAMPHLFGEALDVTDLEIIER